MRRTVLVLALVAVGFVACAQGWAPRAPIYIHGDDAFTWANGVVRGSGTEGDPYIIEGWVIETAGYDYGIYISGTTAHFVIRNCQVRYPQERAGIFLSNVVNGRIEQSAVFGGRVGIHLLAAKQVTITGNAVGYCDYGILLSSGSNNNRIYGNSIIKCGLPARDEGLRNVWHHEGRGNYWSDYRGEDRSEDGIGDTTYEVVPDRFPLMKPPVELPRDAGPMRTIDLERVSERGIVTLAPGSLVRLQATDVGVGVDKIHYRIEDGAWKVYDQPFPLEGQAKIRFEYYAVDKLGNREPTRALTVYLDTEPPVTRIVAGDPHYKAPDKLWATSRTPFTLISEDDSGVAHIFYRINEVEWREYREPFTIPGPEGPHKVEYYAIDLYGNREAVQSTVVWKDDTAPVTEATTKDDDSPFDLTAPEEPELEVEPEPEPPVPDDPEPEELDPEVTEPESAAVETFAVVLTEARLVEEYGVEGSWTLSYSMDGFEAIFQTASVPLVLYAGQEDELEFSLGASVEGVTNHVGQATVALEPPWAESYHELDMTIAPENDMRAIWQFVIEVRKEEGE